MNPLSHHFIEPLDVLFLRGNKLFGDPGSHGESLVPPWPSVAAGALRSMLLSADGVDLDAFARGDVRHPTLGTPAEPGSFRLCGFDLARRGAAGSAESLHALPADLVVLRDDAGALQVNRLQPTSPAVGLASSAPLPQWPVLSQARRDKPVGGHWLTQAGWAAYLGGATPSAQHLVASTDLWKLDLRIGIGIDAETRSAADTQLFTAQAVAMAPGVGFLVASSGAELPSRAVLRLGGDGRGAELQAVKHTPCVPDPAKIAQARRCRIVLTSPGLFEQGWHFANSNETRQIDLPGIRARLACAVVSRPSIVSGWDLARRQPKAAERMAPTGSVFWLDELDTTPEQLRKLVEHGLWPAGTQNSQRQAEGFNRFSLAPW